MEQEKQELVAKLYGLRGGLSVLSSIYDEAAAIQQHMKTSDKEIWRHCDEIGGSRADLKDKKEEYSETILEVTKKLKDAEERASKEKHFARVYTLGTTLLILSALVLVSFIWNQAAPDSAPFFVAWGVGLLEILIYPFSLISETAATIAGVVLLIAAGIGSLGCSGIHFIIKDTIKSIQDAKRASNDLAEKSRLLASLKHNQDKNYKKMEQEHEKRENAIKAKIAPLEKQIAEDKQKMTVLIAEFQAVYKATQEQFGSVLDERDWGNVDLIIFNYETGRALDMRDALLQVDNERRNERLVKAVHEASEAISTTMRRGFGALETAITKQLRSLDHRITSISEEMSGTVAQIAESADRQSNALGRIADENAAQQALLSKINTSSDKMAADISALRQIASKTK